MCDSVQMLMSVIETLINECACDLPQVFLVCYWCIVLMVVSIYLIIVFFSLALHARAHLLDLLPIVYMH